MRPAAAALAALASLATPSFADEAVDAAITDFVTVCPAAALAPETAADAGKSVGLTNEMSIPFGKSLHSSAYQTQDATRMVTVTEQRFSDATYINCLVVIQAELDIKALGTVREKLEANPLIGPMEGLILPMPSGYRTGSLKAAGLDPIIAVSFAANAAAATLILNAWHLDPDAARE